MFGFFRGTIEMFVEKFQGKLNSGNKFIRGVSTKEKSNN